MVEQNIKGFHESITKELISVKDRVRSLIGDKHWGEEGRYKEAVLRNVISKFLPQGYSVGTGFVINRDKQITRQLDILVYDNSSPILFSQGDLVVVLAHTVRAIIEVKAEIHSSIDLKKAIIRSEENAEKIHSWTTKDRPLFNGVFSYECGISYDSLKISLQEYFFGRQINFLRKVNDISLGKDKFLHLWRKDGTSLRCYELENLSFSYFISNLLTYIDSNPVPWEHNTLLFPLDSKEPFEKFTIHA